VLNIVLQFFAAHVHGLPYTLDVEAGFVFPSSLRLPFFIPILQLYSSITTRAATTHHRRLGLPLLQAPFAVALEHPRPLHAAVPQALTVAESC
jgi:hypothetical protein